MAEDLSKRKLLSGLSHGAIFLSATVVSVGIPIAIYLVSEDPIVKENAQESLNFHFNVWLYGIIFGILAFFLIGIPLLWVLGIVSIVAPIFAIVKIVADANAVFRYPFIFRLL
ncbi:MAG: DUF4870 domain-containing protein [Spirulinaceae cyanobacterium]